MKGASAMVGGGPPPALLACRSAEAGFAGVERFIGIPGTVGGGVYMNAGAHGAEFAEVLTEATVMDAKGKIKQVPRKQISFKYRSSNLGAVVVLEAKLALIEEPPAKLKDVQARLHVLELRRWLLDQRQLRLQHDHRPEVGRAVFERDLLARHLLDLALRVHDRRLGQHLGELRSVRAGVHVHATAHRSRDADEALHT